MLDKWIFGRDGIWQTFSQISLGFSSDQVCIPGDSPGGSSFDYCLRYWWSVAGQGQLLISEHIVCHFPSGRPVPSSSSAHLEYPQFAVRWLSLVIRQTNSATYIPIASHIHSIPFISMHTFIYNFLWSSHIGALRRKCVLSTRYNSSNIKVEVEAVFLIILWLVANLWKSVG